MVSISDLVGRASLPGSGSEHLRAVLTALLVTLLWSSSYVLIKIGLESIPALTFAGLRYAIATLVLVPLFISRGEHRRVARLGSRDLGYLVALGLLLYAVTQGAQFVALQYLRAATISLVLSFTPAVVALLSIPALDERPSGRQAAWLLVLLLGVGVYFYPFTLRDAALFGLLVMLFGLLANSLSSILGRALNRDGPLSPLAVTTVSMGLGSSVLLATGLTVQGLPELAPTSWAIVLWLAVVNTALAFTLWNGTLQTLSATESSVINNSMLVQIAILGWVFLGETLSGLEILGLALVSIGVLGVQLAD